MLAYKYNFDIVLVSPYLIRHGELKEVEPIGVPLHDDLLEVLQVLKYRKNSAFRITFMELIVCEMNVQTQTSIFYILINVGCILWL